jgi:hypothetical protein
LQQILALLVRLAEGLHLRRSHVAVDEHIGPIQLTESLLLHLTSRLNALTDGCGGFTAVERGEFWERHTLEVKVNVNTVHQRAADAFLILADHALRAGTLLAVIAIIPARAGILTMCHFLLWLH